MEKEGVTLIDRELVVSYYSSVSADTEKIFLSAAPKVQVVANEAFESIISTTTASITSTATTNAVNTDTTTITTTTTAAGSNGGNVGDGVTALPLDPLLNKFVLMITRYKTN